MDTRELKMQLMEREIQVKRLEEAREEEKEWMIRELETLRIKVSWQISPAETSSMKMDI